MPVRSRRCIWGIPSSKIHIACLKSLDIISACKEDVLILVREDLEENDDP